MAAKSSRIKFHKVVVKMINIKLATKLSQIMFQKVVVKMIKEGILSYFTSLF